MDLAQLKNGSDTSIEWAIPIHDANGDIVGHLIPVGHWILDKPELIKSISRWRQTFMRMFLAQFVSTFEKTYSYLKHLAIDQPDRVLFMIRTVDGFDVGHIGLSNITPSQAELDNLMRGEHGGHVRLAFFAELAILQWAFSNLLVRRITARVLSYNWLALEMHREVGFREIARLPLRRVVNGDDVHHMPIAPNEEANVNYACLELALNHVDLLPNTPRKEPSVEVPHAR